VSIEIEYQNYVRNVRSSSTLAPVLAARLVKAAPVDLTTVQKKALRFVVECADEIAATQSERDRMGPGKLRPVLDAYTNDWTAFYQALAAKARVPSRVSDVGHRAQKLEESLFPDGVSFTKLPAESAWSEGKRRITRIDDEELAREIADLIGEEFVTAARDSTSTLADAIGTGAADHTTPSSTGVSERLLKFGRAVGRYGRLLVGDCDEDDPASVERFLKAMAPIDVHRAAMRAGGTDAGDEPPAPTEEPTPPTTNGAADAHT
jgi:hypothetical protein